MSGLNQKDSSIEASAPAAFRSDSPVLSAATESKEKNAVDAKEVQQLLKFVDENELKGAETLIQKNPLLLRLAYATSIKTATGHEFAKITPLQLALCGS